MRVRIWADLESVVKVLGNGRSYERRPGGTGRLLIVLTGNAADQANGEDVGGGGTTDRALCTQRRRGEQLAR